MTYWVLNSLFLGGVAVIAIAAVASRRAPRWLAVLIGGGILVIATVIFDNVIIAVGIVDYDRGQISGVYIGSAPVEDFAYAVAAIVLLPCLWTLLPARRARG